MISNTIYRNSFRDQGYITKQYIHSKNSVVHLTSNLLEYIICHYHNDIRDRAC